MDNFYGTTDTTIADAEDQSELLLLEMVKNNLIWDTEHSIVVDDKLSEQQTLTSNINNFSPNLDLQEAAPPPKSSSSQPIVPTKYPNQNSTSSSIPEINSNGHLLPPVATGESFATTFNRIETANIKPHNTQKRPADFNLAVLSNFQRSASSPTRHHSLVIPNCSRPHSSVYNQKIDTKIDERFSQDDINSLNRFRNRSRTSIDESQVVDRGVAQNGKLETELDKNSGEQNSRRLYQRKMAIKELIDTEAVYFKDMNVVEEIYKGTADTCPNFEASDIKIVFRNTKEIVSFSNTLLEDLKLAASPIYKPRGRKLSPYRPDPDNSSDPENPFNKISPSELSEEWRDSKTHIGASFGKHLPMMQVIYTNYLKSSETASSRLAELQKDPAVKVWLCECNTVAKDLTSAWDIDALLVKPVQRITRYQLLLKQIQTFTPASHPDSEALIICCNELSKLLKDIDDFKKRIDMVAKMVSRKRKESDNVRTGIAKAFGRRTEKTSGKSNQNTEDEEYLKIIEKFSDDYLRLQVVLRDAEYYTRQVSSHVSDHLRFFSAIELIMRMSPNGHPDIENKWAKFNVSIREIGTIYVEDHISEVRKFVIEPFEKTISAYYGPLLATKKRDKRKVDFDKVMSLKSQGKKVDEKLQNLSDEFSALHETLKWELPKLSQLTETMGKIILGRFICIQVRWYEIWMKKLHFELEENGLSLENSNPVEHFKSQNLLEKERIFDLGIINGNLSNESSTRISPSRPQSRRDSETKNLPRLDTEFTRLSSATLNDNRTQPSTKTSAPVLTGSTTSITENHNRTAPISPAERYNPSITRSSSLMDSSSRLSSERSTYRGRESTSWHSLYHDGPQITPSSQSGIFHSALPMGNSGEGSRSRGSSRYRKVSGGYTVLYLAASLFEFNISATKQEAGYPYLTYQAGEIFDVIGEKGELWMAKNQDDTTDTVGWIWSKHFARLADS